MKKILVFLTGFSFLFFVNRAVADDSTIYPIKQGESSPYEGLLLTPTAIATILTDKKLAEQKCSLLLSKCEEKTKSEITRIVGESQINSEKQVAIFTKEKADLNTAINALKEDIKKKDNLLSQTNNTNYYFLGGLAIGISATLLTTYVISNTAN